MAKIMSRKAADPSAESASGSKKKTGSKPAVKKAYTEKSALSPTDRESSKKKSSSKKTAAKKVASKKKIASKKKTAVKKATVADSATELPDNPEANVGAAEDSASASSSTSTKVAKTKVPVSKTKKVAAAAVVQNDADYDDDNDNDEQDIPSRSTVVPYERGTGHYMSGEQLTHFSQKLADWKQQLMEEVDRTVGHMKDDATNFPDPNDRATQEEEFSLELRTRDRERKLIKKINEAQKRIDDDEYGYCQTCGIEIGVNRLEARPTAELCIDCKTLEEIRERQTA